MRHRLPFGLLRLAQSSLLAHEIEFFLLSVNSNEHNEEENTTNKCEGGKYSVVDNK